MQVTIDDNNTTQVTLDPEEGSLLLQKSKELGMTPEEMLAEIIQAGLDAYVG